MKTVGFALAFLFAACMAFVIFDQNMTKDQAIAVTGFGCTAMIFGIALIRTGRTT